MPPVRMLMLRHGATQGNTEKRYIGTTDESILPSEKERLSDAAFRSRMEEMIGESRPVIFVSPLKRTAETAAAIFPEGRQRVIPEFRECDFGAFENRNYQELSGRSDYQAWIDSGGTLPFPGGESMETFRKRTLSGFDRVVEICRREALPSAVLVVHGGTIMSILSSYARPAGSYFDFQVKPGCGYLVTFDPESFKDEQSGSRETSGLKILETVEGAAGREQKRMDGAAVRERDRVNGAAGREKKHMDGAAVRERERVNGVACPEQKRMDGAAVRECERVNGAAGREKKCKDDRVTEHGAKALRNGFTTGTCAAAAACAAAYRLLSGAEMKEVPMVTPDGTCLSLPTEALWCEGGRAGCGVRKDAGDDIDATDGLLICAEVEKSTRPGIHIDGGAGVGRVTKKGLDQPVGNAAINSVPRRMIAEAVRHAAEDAGYDGGLDVLITVPGGEEAAPKTFNGRLGIEGGISILGTSGIVHPMSRRALLESIYTEMRMHRESSGPWLCLCPGNYGERFALEELGVDPEKEMLCSNFIGETVDKAVELGFGGIIFAAHIGKFIKVSGGIMNTHSKEADCRMELMAAAALKAGCDADTARRILACNTTDDAIELLSRTDLPEGLLQKTMDSAAAGIAHYLDIRSGGKIETGAVIFSDRFGKLAETKNAGALLAHLRAGN